MSNDPALNVNLETLDKVRAHAEETGAAKLTDEEIQAEVDATRLERMERFLHLESEQREAERALRDAAIVLGEGEVMAEANLLRAADRYAQARRAAMALIP